MSIQKKKIDKIKRKIKFRLSMHDTTWKLNMFLKTQLEIRVSNNPKYMKQSVILRPKPKIYLNSLRRTRYHAFDYEHLVKITLRCQ